MNHITFLDSADEIQAEQLQGFFVGWKSVPSPEMHLQLLKESSYRVLAMDDEKVVGFITAISDKTLAAYIPFLEVLPDYQKRGIGQELVQRMLVLLEGYYMIDLLCDPELQSFYEHLGMHKADGMRIRRYENQSGLGK